VKIQSVEADWLHVPLAAEKQHRSDFGHITAFDVVLVRVRTEDGSVGYGEAKPAVGSSGNGSALVAIVEHELAPLLVGQDAAQIGALGTAHAQRHARGAGAAARGRAMPILGRRGLHQAAIAGVDLALWDLLGKAHDCSVLALLGGACEAVDPGLRERRLGERGAHRRGARLATSSRASAPVKMRVGAMDGGVRASLARVRAARAALGPGVALMVDAHGTLNVAEAKPLLRRAGRARPALRRGAVASDDRAGLAEVRRSAALPIAAGESELSCFDFAELIERRAVDVLQPDLAIAGGFSEGQRIAALTWSSRLELAPHCWGSAISFQAARTLASLRRPARSSRCRWAARRSCATWRASISRSTRERCCRRSVRAGASSPIPPS
jgi:L-alanine-DL-glutamate epimerase-like enolase superfamily enzyme